MSICARMPADTIAMTNTAISISMSENPRRTRRAKFLVFILIPLSDHRANAYRWGEQHRVIVGTLQLRRNRDLHDVRRGRHGVPPDVVDGLLPVGAANGIKLVIACRVARAARGLGEVRIAI